LVFAQTRFVGLGTVVRFVLDAGIFAGLGVAVGPTPFAGEDICGGAAIGVGVNGTDSVGVNGADSVGVKGINAVGSASSHVDVGADVTKEDIAGTLGVGGGEFTGAVGNGTSCLCAPVCVTGGDGAGVVEIGVGSGRVKIGAALGSGGARDANSAGDRADEDGTGCRAALGSAARAKSAATNADIRSSAETGSASS
jgi:hypothetical protein